MKHVMDLPCFGKVELVCDWRQDFDDCEGSFMFWSEFQVGDGVFQVPDF